MVGVKQTKHIHHCNTTMMLRANPTVHVPPWPMVNDPTTEIFSPLTATNADYDYSPFYLQEALSALEQYAPSSSDGADSDSADVYSCDQFRMFEFKVRNCARGRSHDWTECPYAHPGEKARRRDPRKFHYSGASCADFRKGSCKKGDACEFAHGVFECWLHPARYRTQPCKDGTSCRRRVCFFAHTPEQLRVLPQHSPRSVADSYDGSPLRLAIEFQSACAKTLPFAAGSSSAGSVSPPAETLTPPMSPVARSLCSSSVGVSEMVMSLRNLQLSKVKSLPSSWNVQMGSPRFGSPRGPVIRPGFCSLPSTPGRGGGVSYFDLWDQKTEEEPVMERVESGRGIRAKMFEKLSKENSLDRSGSGQEDGAPNVGWVSDLVSPFFSG